MKGDIKEMYLLGTIAIASNVLKNSRTDRWYGFLTYYSALVVLRNYLSAVGSKFN